MEQLFEVEVPLPYHLWGMEFFDMPGVISAHPSKELTGSPTCEPQSLPLTLHPCRLSYTHSSFRTFLSFLSLYQFSHLWAERASCFGCEKSIAIIGGRERRRVEEEKRRRRRRNTLEREGGRLLSLSVWPCLTAVISLNCFANIIPTQPGTRSARPLCWSWLQAVLLHDLSVSPPFFPSFLFPL